MSTFKKTQNHQFCTWLAKPEAATYAEAQAKLGSGDGVPAKKKLRKKLRLRVRKNPPQI